MIQRILLWTFAAAILFVPDSATSSHYKTYRKHAKVKNHSAPAYSPILSQQKELMLNDLGFIQNLFKITYAPTEWKNELFGWNLEQEISDVRQNIMLKMDLSVKEFQMMLRTLLNRIRDYHVQIEFYSTETARLPFSIQRAEGKYYIVYIDSSKIDPTNPFPFSLGDELVSFNGQEIQKAVEQFKNISFGINNDLTEQALAEMYFTRRFGDMGDEVPKGPVTLFFRKVGTGEFFGYNMEWEYGFEKISEDFLQREIQASTLKSTSSAKLAQSNNFLDNQFITPHFKNLGIRWGTENEPSVKIGSKKNMIPALGEILWEASEEMIFHAYLFTLPNGRKASYIRIPTYNINDNNATEEFSEIIKRFEEESEVLVIDQMSNPGGKVLYLYSLLALLTDQPLTVPKDRSKITQENVFYAYQDIDALSGIKDTQMAVEEFGEMWNGYQVDFDYVQGILNYSQGLIDQWNEGKTFTDFQYHYGIESIKPNTKVNYTKPILVLVNSLDFSGGDFFPAILQDNHRATIMGTKTAGAGGKVEKFYFPNLNGIKHISLTTSFALRPNGLPIENLGVTPDIPYEFTAFDLQNNYADFVGKILEVLSKTKPDPT
ncbi:MAG TPA: protease-like activity factor CPAF [Parachlamydiaceae bacterium]|nr:protease-like activity factor CPAF [Parachlamydiaceae bacterium]